MKTKLVLMIVTGFAIDLYRTNKKNHSRANANRELFLYAISALDKANVPFTEFDQLALTNLSSTI